MGGRFRCCRPCIDGFRRYTFIEKRQEPMAGMGKVNLHESPDVLSPLLPSSEVAFNALLRIYVQSKKLSARPYVLLLSSSFSNPCPTMSCVPIMPLSAHYMVEYAPAVMTHQHHATHAIHCRTKCPIEHCVVWVEHICAERSLEDHSKLHQPFRISDKYNGQ